MTTLHSDVCVHQRRMSISGSVRTPVPNNQVNVKCPRVRNTEVNKNRKNTTELEDSFEKKSSLSNTVSDMYFRTYKHFLAPSI